MHYKCQQSKIMSKKSAWYKNPVSIAALIVSFLSISSWIANTIIADAKQAAKIEKTEKKIAELDEAVEEHEGELEQSEVRQQLLQQDVGYIKKAMEQQQMIQQQILEAVKKK